MGDQNGGNQGRQIALPTYQTINIEARGNVFLETAVHRLDPQRQRRTTLLHRKYDAARTYRIRRHNVTSRLHVSVEVTGTVLACMQKKVETPRSRSWQMTR